MALFGRTYRLLVGRPASSQSGAFGVLVEDNLRLTFQITKTTTKNPNTSTISIWNLSEAKRIELEKPDVRCYLYAGYREEIGAVLIFQGNVTFVYSKKHETDWETVLELADGAKEIRDSAVSLGYAPGVDNKTILRDIAANMGLALSLSDDAASRTWTHGFSFYGAARLALDKIVRGSGLEWSIQNGVLQVIQNGGTTSRRAIVLRADSGLIGSPDRQRQGAREAATVTDVQTNRQVQIRSSDRQRDGWKATSLLMPTVNAGDAVRLESRSVQQTLVAISVEHKGDSEDGDWQTTMELVTAAQAQKVRSEYEEQQKKAADTAAKKAGKTTALNLPGNKEQKPNG